MWFLPHAFERCAEWNRVSVSAARLEPPQPGAGHRAPRRPIERGMHPKGELRPLSERHGTRHARGGRDRHDAYPLPHRLGIRSNRIMLERLAKDARVFSTSDERELLDDAMVEMRQAAEMTTVSSDIVSPARGPVLDEDRGMTQTLVRAGELSPSTAAVPRGAVARSRVRSAASARLGRGELEFGPSTWGRARGSEPATSTAARG